MTTLMAQRSARINEAELDQLRDGEWHLDCTHIRLRRCSDTPHIAFSGPGEITEDRRGQLTFRFFARRKGSFMQVLQQLQLEPGRVYSDDHLYNVEATDTRGRTWQAERLPIDLSLASSRHLLVSGRTKRITARALGAQGRPYLVLEAFDDPGIPFNAGTVESTSFPRSPYQTSKHYKRNVWKFRCLETDFRLWQKRPDLLILDARGDGIALPERFAERVTEAVQLVLGKPVEWRLLFQCASGEEATTILSRRQGGSGHRWPSPLGHRTLPEPGKSKDTARFHRKLFECYLRCTAGSPKLRHDIWGRLNRVYEASAASFTDAYALELCVAVEGMLEENAFQSTARPTTASRAVVDNLAAHIDRWDGDETIKQRARGCISQLKQARADDKLRALAQQGLVRASDVEAWRELRHRLAHGGFLPAGDGNWERPSKVQVLLNHLVFAAIGYKGPYMDYGTPGWPMKEYPTTST